MHTFQTLQIKLEGSNVGRMNKVITALVGHSKSNEIDLGYHFCLQSLQKLKICAPFVAK